MTDTASNFPYGAPVDSKGNLTPQWRLFFLTLFNRTGAESGNDSAALLILIQDLKKALDALTTELNGDILSNEAVTAPAIDVGAQIAALGIAVQQAFAAIAVIQHAIPAYGEIFSAGGSAPQFTEMTFASI